MRSSAVSDPACRAAPSAAGSAHLQRAGALAALLMAATFLVGFALYSTVLLPSGYLAGDPARSAAFLVDNSDLMYAWNFVIYILFGALLVVLSLALCARLQADTPALAQVATAFGILWAGLALASGMVANIALTTVVTLHAEDAARAEALWLSMRTVERGLGGGNEFAGGLWVLLINIAGLRTGRLSKGLGRLGVVVGAAGLLTVVPALELFGAVFGLSFIVWFVWVGIVMWREDHAPPCDLDPSRREDSVESRRVP